MANETVFTMDTSSIKFGPGATREVGADAVRLGCRRIMLVTDPRLAGGQQVATARDALRRANVEVDVFDRVQVEPTDASFKEAITVAGDPGRTTAEKLLLSNAVEKLVSPATVPPVMVHWAVPLLATVTPAALKVAGLKWIETVPSRSPLI